MLYTSGADLHALFSLLDKDDRGSVDIGEFTRNYQATSTSRFMSSELKLSIHLWISNGV